MLLTPIWLFGLAAIGIPVVIHLWNIRPGETLKVGSIALFTESSPKSSRSFKLQDLFLLLLRCLLLILLAFLLAAPFWQQHLKPGKVKGWLLIPKENFNEAYRHFKPTIDSCNKQGYELHYFNRGFARIDLNTLLQHPTKDTAVTQPANYWALIKQLDHQIPASVTAEIFTPNTVNHFIGIRPASPLKLNWHTFTPADSVHTWLADAWLTGNGNIRVMQGKATPLGISYQYHDIKNGGQPGSPYVVSVENGKPLVSFNRSKLIADTTTQRVAIYTDKNTVDAGYVKAALQAIAQLNERKTIINTYTQPEAIPTGQNWIFWLSEKPVGDATIQKTKNLFKYEAGKAIDLNSWISNSGAYNIIQGAAKISLYKTINTKAAAGHIIWIDGFGHAVLRKEEANINIYHFYSRFNPAWSDLVWNDAFPKWVLNLTYPAQTKTAAIHERRSISNSQLQPAHITRIENVPGEQTNNIKLSNYLWLALLFVFLTERWLATKNKTALTNG